MKGGNQENRNLVDFTGSDDPHAGAILQGSIAKRVMRVFGSSGIVYDLSAIRCYRPESMLSEYAHNYNSNGENREINFVMAVTRNSGVPVHHRIRSGNIVSVSSVGDLVNELKDSGIHIVMIVMDRGFYSISNMNELGNHSIIGAIPRTLSIYSDLIRRFSGIENSKNYM